MKVKLKILFLLVCLVGLSIYPTTGAFADPMVEYNTSGEATGITNLPIAGMEGMFFNVNFIDGSYNSVYAIEAPFFNDGEDAGAANNSLIAVLKTNNVRRIQGITGECGVSSTRGGLCEIITPFALIPPGLTYEFFGAHTDGGNFWIPILGASDITANHDWSVFTQFTKVAPIPEPSTMLLFGTGLAGLAAWRWKTSKPT